MSNWSTLYGLSPITLESSYTLAHQAWPDAAVDTNHPNEVLFDGLTITLDDSHASNDGYLQLYVDMPTEGFTFLGSSDEVSLTDKVPMFIYSGDNSDSENSAIGKTDTWPVLVKGD